MTFTLKLGEPIWKLVGEKSLKVDMEGAQTLADVVREMNRRYPGFLVQAQSGNFELPYSLFVNDTLVRWEQVEQAPVHDGDKLFIFMAVSGG